MKTNTKINFYFLLGFPDNLTKNPEDIEILDYQSEKTASQLKAFEHDNKFIIIFCLKISQKYDLNLKLKYNKNEFRKKSPIKINSKKDIFYYKNMEFPECISYFFFTKFFSEKPPSLITLVAKEFFYYYFQYFKNLKDKDLEDFLEYSFKIIFKNEDSIQKLFNNFNEIDKICSIKKSTIINTKCFYELIELFINKLSNEKDGIKFLFEFLGQYPFYQNIILKILFQEPHRIENVIKQLFDNLLDILSFTQFHDEWLVKLIQLIKTKFTDEECDCKSSIIYCQESIFRLIKNPFFIFNKFEKEISNEEKLRDIFNFITLFKIENFDDEYSILIPSNQMEFYEILYKEKGIYKKFNSSILIEINNYDDLYKWFKKSINKNIAKTLEIIIRNKEYIYIILFREGKKLIINEENLTYLDQNKIKHLAYFKNILEIFQKEINYNFIEFEKSFNVNLEQNENIIVYKGQKHRNNYTYKICDKCMFFINKLIIDNHKSNNCYNNEIICYNCFNSIPIKEYAFHNIDKNKCFRKEDFYQKEIDTILKPFSIENFIFLDYFFKKDNFYLTNAFSKFMKSKCDEFGKDKYNYNCEIFDFLEEYFFSNHFLNYYYLLIDKMGEFISNQTNRSDLYDILQIVLNKLLKRNKDILYSNIIYIFIDITTDKNKGLNVKDNWLELLSKFKKEFISDYKSKNYNYLINKIVALLCDISFSLNKNWYSCIEYFYNEFVLNNDIEHYDYFMLKIISFINSEQFFKDNNWYSYTLKLEEKFLDENREKQQKELYSKINEIMKNKLLIEQDKYFDYLKYFLKQEKKINKEKYDNLIEIIIELIKNKNYIEKNGFIDLIEFIIKQLKDNNSLDLYNKFLNAIITIFDKKNFVKSPGWIEFTYI